MTGDLPRLSIISPDGKEIRTLAAGPELGGWGGVAVPADGSVIYTTIDDPTGDASCTDIGALPAVARIAVAGGQPVRLARGGGPIVSGDGRWLAFSPSQDCGSEEGSAVLPTLTVIDLRTGGVTQPVPRDPRGGGVPVAWSLDGKALIVSGRDLDGDKLPDGLILRRAHPNRHRVRIDVPGSFESAVYRPDGRIVVEYRSRDRRLHRFVTIGKDGHVRRHLFDSELAVSGSPGSGAQLSADARGRILVSFDHGYVQVWTPGDPNPATLFIRPAPGAIASGAAWLPD